MCVKDAWLPRLHAVPQHRVRVALWACSDLQVETSATRESPTISSSDHGGQLPYRSRQIPSRVQLVAALGGAVRASDDG